MAAPRRCPRPSGPGRVWTGDPDDVLPALEELLGTETLLLRSLDEDEDDTGRRQRATVLAVPRAAPALPEGMAWLGRGDLAAARTGPDGDAVLAARVAGELEGGRLAAGPPPWAARGWFAEAELRLRLRDAYLPVWASFEPPDPTGRSSSSGPGA